MACVVALLAQPDELDHLVDAAAGAGSTGRTSRQLSDGEVVLDPARLQDDADALPQRALAPTGIHAEHPRVARRSGVR